MRSKARECAFKIVFASLFNGEGEQAFRRGIYKSAGLEQEDKTFADALADAVLRNRAELEELLGRYSVGFSVERLFPVDKSLLLLAVAEMRYVKEAPPVVVVNEAVGLAKKYSTEKSVGFVNGILAAFLTEEVKQ